MFTPAARKNSLATVLKRNNNSCMTAHVPGLITEGSTCELLQGMKFKSGVSRYFCRTCRHPAYSRILLNAAAQMLPGSSRRRSSTDVGFMPCWLPSQFMFHFLPSCSCHLTSLTTFLLRIDSLGGNRLVKDKSACCAESFGFHIMLQLPSVSS